MMQFLHQGNLVGILSFCDLNYIIRDLAIVLNACNMIGEHKEVQLQDIGHPQLTHSSSKRESAVDVLSNPRRKPTDHELQTKILFAHLCATSGIDCSKSLSNEDK